MSTAVATPALAVAAPAAKTAVATKVTPKAEKTAEAGQDMPAGRTRRRRSAAAEVLQQTL
jgi:ribonuclease J